MGSGCGQVKRQMKGRKARWVTVAACGKGLEEMGCGRGPPRGQHLRGLVKGVKGREKSSRLSGLGN